MKHDWKELQTKAKKAVEKTQEEFFSWADLAKYLGVPKTTLFDASVRGDFDQEGILVEPPSWDKPKAEKAHTTQIRGNTATVKYNAAEPLSPKELFEIANLDPEEWKISDQRINAWQMGRKDRAMDIEYSDGKATGSINDSGGIHKEYLYQVEIKLTRIKRIAVKAVLQPVLIQFPKQEHEDFREVDFNELFEEEYDGPLDETDGNITEILFIADPHFGFIRKDDNSLVPFQDREFLGGLLNIADHMNPDVVIWNGDVLDLADMSTFATEPAILNNLQAAGIELSWLLAAFNRFAQRQIILEGNHEVRINKAMIANFKAAFGLKPIHDLEGYPMMSVPRFLGLDELGIEWVDGYPDNFIQVGKARFTHGNVVRKGSARTVAAEIADATVSRFFGHIHRMEIAQKHIPDRNEDVFVGSPGCACVKGRVPGSSDSHNWQTGAFYITLNGNGSVKTVETIYKNHAFEGATIRGFEYTGSYWEDFLKSLEGSTVENLFLGAIEK